MNKLFFELIEQIALLGIHLELYIESPDIFCADLNTQAKSHCILKLEDGEVFAYRRYGLKDKVESLDDVIFLVHGCAHGRSYFSSDWLNVFTDKGLKNPCGNL